MSHELFELFSMLGAGVGLSALFHRAVQPVLRRLAGDADESAQYRELRRIGSIDAPDA